ncbi:winged helix-turn-helix domain-containing protein [Nocardioides sp. cx-169]|uniref:AfsR/SARP family transcriptional regulator n=1 Tax=Nocardioides sp. cx-169 TaxID=2899080 RepID=UPI001E60C558|nr:BTAD domain-containing putative transcriptional regulator [Nocardioides sp. cx-169]MCD4536385.1 winged helix-turn-helix domain-containing protein [Nocardioides sp. cx-169]
MVSVTGHLFGAATFTRDGRPVSLPPASTALLAYLLLRHGQPVDRDRLADVVGESESDAFARRRLNTAVWRLRRQLEPDGVARDSVLTSVGHGVAVSPTCEVWVDAVEFATTCRHLPPYHRWSDADAERVTRAVALYRGDFLGGTYTDWALRERGRLSDLHLQALVGLAEWLRLRGRADDALEHARAAVAAEPLREDLHRLVMQLYADAGLPQLAARQLARCRQLLGDELGVEPLPETVAVARVSTTMRHPSAETYDRAIRELERSDAELRRAAARLRRSLRELRLERERLARR